MDIKDKAKQLWLKAGGNNAEKGTLTLIADELGVSQATVRSWKNRYKWDNATGKSETKGKKKRNVAEELTFKEKNLVDNFIANKGNKTAAAKAAGYSEKTAYCEGHKVLNKPKVAEYLRQRQDEISQKLHITQEYIIQELLDNALRAKGVIKNNKTIVLKEGMESVPTDCDIFELDLNASTKAFVEIRKILGIGEDFKKEDKEDKDDKPLSALDILEQVLMEGVKDE